MHPPLPPAHAVVLDAEAALSPELGETVTVAHLLDGAGVVHEARIVGGPSARGGVTRLAGYVVPVAGATVRLDLREEPPSFARPLPEWVTNTPAGTWASAPVAFWMAAPPSRDLGADETGEIDVALRVWPRVACTGYRTSLAGTTGAAPGDDGVNGIYWHDASWPAALQQGVIGQTVLHTDATGRYYDADLHFDGADNRFSLDGAGTTVDARSVLVHELGHALGLGHSTVAGATMDPAYPGGIAWRSLEADDRAGVCALYPGTGAAGCEVGPSCPNGFVCVAHVCERKGVLGEVCSPCARVPGACAGAGDDARCIDIGSGPTAGRVCGRACTTDADCGPRFACRPTTTSGDVQCVPTDGCASGPDPCTNDTDCAPPAVCRGGACVGLPDTTDAGVADAASNEGGNPNGLTVGGGGCAMTSATPDARGGAPLLLALAALARKIHRKAGRREGG